MGRPGLNWGEGELEGRRPEFASAVTANGAYKIYIHLNTTDWPRKTFPFSKEFFCIGYSEWKFYGATLYTCNYSYSKLLSQRLFPNFGLAKSLRTF